MVTRGKVPVEVERKGSDEPIQLTVDRRRSDHAGRYVADRRCRAGAVFLIRVTPGSPADRAGLRALDRIYEVSGQRFKTSDEFRQLVDSLNSPIELLTESRGQLRHVECRAAGDCDRSGRKNAGSCGHGGTLALISNLKI